MGSGHDHHGHDHGHEGHDHAGHGHAGHDHAGHGHGGHGHSHAPANFDRAFAIGVGLNTALVAGQAIFGFMAGSLALMADAGHNLGDVLGLVIAWVASVLLRRPPTARRTYGYGRGTILASLTNAVILLIGVGAIVLAAIQRLLAPEPVAEMTVVWVALAAILVNGFTAWMFMRGSKDDINIRGAFLHMAADAGVSAGVVVAALLIRATGWLWLDPVVGLAIAVTITWGTWGLLRDSVALAMDEVPKRIDGAAVQSYLAGLPGVSEVHDLHIWGLSTKDCALTAHLVRPAAGPDDALLAEACAQLRQRFGIGHATLQVECGDHPCALAPADVV